MSLRGFDDFARRVDAAETEEELAALWAEAGAQGAGPVLWAFVSLLAMALGFLAAQP